MVIGVICLISEKVQAVFSCMFGSHTAKNGDHRILEIFQVEIKLNLVRGVHRWFFTLFPTPPGRWPKLQKFHCNDFSEFYLYQGLNIDD